MPYESRQSWIKLEREQALDLVRKLLRGTPEVEFSVDDDLNITLRPIAVEDPEEGAAASDRQRRAAIFEADTGDIWVEGRRAETLTPQEHTLFSYLHSREGSIVTKEEVCQALWPDRSAAECTASLDKLLSRLRAKIEPNPAKPRYLLTLRGRGYRLKTE